MKPIILDLIHEEATEEMAKPFAHRLSAPLTLGFSGEIGAGKTTFIRALFREMGVLGAIKSPTYTLVESYMIRGLPIHHFDLYRIHEESELEYIGFRDYFMVPALCCIEWPERVQSGLESIDLQFDLSMKGDGRELTLYAKTQQGQALLSSVLCDIVRIP